MKIKIESHERFGQCRVGEGWVVAIDVARILGYVKGTTFANKHVARDDKRYEPVRALNATNVAKTLLVNKAGVEAMIEASANADAEEIRAWVLSIMEKEPPVEEANLPQVLDSSFLKTDFARESFLLLNKPCPPQLACVYAFDMSDNTVKIGLTTNIDKREKSVQSAVYLEVKRRHQTGYAPLAFIRVIEARCHATFEDRRERGEYFSITFEEAVAELDKYADEIADVLHAADQKFIAQIDYYYNTFLPEYRKIFAAEPVDFVLVKRTDFLALQERINKLEELAEQAAQALERFKTDKQMSQAARAKELLAIAREMDASPDRQKLLLHAANLINGKKIF